jgi:nitrite reductase/ring-hydroxylating ferredoxin subunit/uncharacterized membrane protein
MDVSVGRQEEVMKRDLTERIESVLIRSGAIRGLASVTQKVMKGLFLNSPLKPFKDFMNGTWLEHPLHSVLTDVPIGGWTVAILLDLIALIFGVANLGLASAIAIGLGVLVALATIATGLMDWMDVDPPELSVGITHGLTNVVATILFAISFIMRWAGSWQITIANFIPAILGYVTVSFGAFLGGSLVFRMGVMINRDAYRAGPDDFVSVLRVDQLPDNKPIRVDAQGQPVCLIRRGEDVYAIGAVCSHYGGPLDEGQLTDSKIQCPWHYSQFSIKDGSVETGPATAPVPAYDVRIKNDQIQVKARNGHS